MADKPIPEIKAFLEGALNEVEQLETDDEVQRVARFLAMKDVLFGMERSFTAAERAAILADVYLPWVRYSDLAREVIDTILQPITIIDAGSG